MEIQSIAAIITIIILIYIICKQYYLDRPQFYLLLSALIMVISLLLSQWITYIAYLILMSWQSVLILNSAKKTYYFDMRNSSQVHNRCVEIFFRINQQQIFLIFYAIILWIWIRISSLKSIDYIIQSQSTFLQYLNGWNCSLPQLWSINLICLILSILSLYSCHFIIKHQADRNYLYKQYLLQYKIYYDVIISLIVTVYNYIAYRNVDKLTQCLDYYHQGWVIRGIWFWGFPLTTILFIYKKHGIFLVQSHSQKAEKQNNLDQKLNQDEIERQYSQKQRNFSGRNQQI